MFDPYVKIQQIKQNIATILEYKIFNHILVAESTLPFPLDSRVAVFPNTELFFKLKEDGLLVATNRFGYRFKDKDISFLFDLLQQWSECCSSINYQINLLSARKIRMLNSPGKHEDLLNLITVADPSNLTAQSQVI